ncbi:MAG: hypothetical protein LBD58_05375, partial [Treponema sp.]|nr:hypothetical protein [Treponema sp.]
MRRQASDKWLNYEAVPKPGWLLERPFEESIVSVSRNRYILAAANFEVSGEELRRRRLSLLPEISRADFDAKRDAVKLYAGRNNRFA